MDALMWAFWTSLAFAALHFLGTLIFHGHLALLDTIMVFFTWYLVLIPAYWLIGKAINILSRAFGRFRESSKDDRNGI